MIIQYLEVFPDTSGTPAKYTKEILTVCLQAVTGRVSAGGLPEPPAGGPALDVVEPEPLKAEP